MTRAFTVSAPASSANLGAGFDAVGLALEIRMTARVRELAPGTSAVWTYAGPHAPTHDGIRSCIERGIARVAPESPPLAVELENAIPLGAGLGSSAAAYALGVAIGAQFANGFSERTGSLGRAAVAGAGDGAALADPNCDERLARAVAELEGHPDNALAAWYGGVVVAALGNDGLTAARFPPPACLAVAVVPDIHLPTEEARALMPVRYDRADAVHNVQRAALLGAALAAGRLDLLRAAVRDRLHQPYRAAMVPGLIEMLALDDPAVVAVALSGAGPSVLALVRDAAGPDGAERVGALIAALFARNGVRSTVLTPALASTGVTVTRAGPA